MKILMQGRNGLFSASGGDRIQIENTASELRRLGVEVDLSDRLVCNLEEYDLIHVFQLDWTPETHFMVKKARKTGKPVVFSPIHHKVSEVQKFDDEYAFGLRRLSKFLFKDQHHRDTVKNVFRCFFQPEKILPTFYSAFLGLKRMHTATLKMADLVLVQTELEASDLKETYQVDFVWEKVPNGVGNNFRFVEGLDNPLKIEAYILSVGRIEPRKNQLMIISAVDKLRQKTGKDLQLVFVGKKNKTYHREYTRMFEKELKRHPWIVYLDGVSYEEMPAYFKFAKVCISASWFETTGLTLLEALFCGTNAVASSPRAKEILGRLVSYCRPDSLTSMVKALEKEFFAPRPGIGQKMKDECTWENVAKNTFRIYNNLLRK